MQAQLKLSRLKFADLKLSRLKVARPEVRRPQVRPEVRRRQIVQIPFRRLEAVEAQGQLQQTQSQQEIHHLKFELGCAQQEAKDANQRAVIIQASFDEEARMLGRRTQRHIEEYHINHNDRNQLFEELQLTKGLLKGSEESCNSLRKKHKSVVDTLQN